MKKTIAIIQARIGSSRLPYKMMLSLHGIPLIEWVVNRVKKSELLDDIIVAIPKNKDNDILEQYIKTLDVKVFRGSEDNVLNRFYEAIKGEGATQIVRICADNPLIDANEIDNLIKFYKNNNCDYAYNHIPKFNLYPDGLGAEIITFDILKNLNNVVKKQSHKEHCLSYIHDNSSQYEIKTFNPLDESLHHPELKFDVDSFDDYYKLCMKDFDINISSKDLVKLFKEN
ncbi:MAG: spore coat biosynthesis protein F [Sulfurimonas sp.]|nr:MAG: spore coat biosynthesis protein F [Sulfurimonas sp.]